MKISMNQVLGCTSLALLIAAAAPSAQANLLSDPGFETNTLTTIANVLGDFVTYKGQWGVENAVITGTVGAVVPFQGIKMLAMLDDGLITTQSAQTIDVTSYASDIDAGGAKFQLSAFFNTDFETAGAIGGVILQFFSGSSYSTQVGSFASGNITLDDNPLTWQQSSIHGFIPVGTRWFVAQVLCDDASLQGHTCYVDATDLSIPEPTTMSLLVISGLFLRRRLRRFGGQSA
ncbi:exported hypothetical protein [Candidatus Accumulibacter aalborgensis]|uniref:PEP-CTERM protein-sorting domain-containing protein n=2 Tax=Candidatus Accumulibacter aalborgensis TaxID=1860102 RepID=A0A1A8XFR6_9PROT|nr:exported hypothetical protein [Candidatus Accumulibacter aalborgensis]